MDWLSFLESFGHVVRYKEMPLVATLEELGLDGSAAKLMERLHQTGKTWDGFMAEQGLCSEKQDPFHVELDQVFHLLFYCVDKYKLLGPFLEQHKSKKATKSRLASRRSGPIASGQQ